MVFEVKIIFAKLRQYFVRIAIACLFLSSSVFPAYGLGLGEIRIRSSLGQALLVNVDLVMGDAEMLTPSCLRGRVVSMDGAFLASANIIFHQNKNKRALSFTTTQAINEPAVKLIIDINCETQLHREFAILLDPADVSMSAAQGAKDESPFSASSTKAGETRIAGESDQAKDALRGSKKAKSRKNEIEISASTPAFSPDKSTFAKHKVVKKQAKDVLKLSDEVIVPNLNQGLRMSDVLSTETGKELLENMQEIRIAQAKMAAILRDEQYIASAATAVNIPVNSAVNDSVEIAKLKQEAEQLKKQSAVDKTALEALKGRAPVDYWLVLLAGIAIVSVLIILLLLFYIRRNVKEVKSRWWENESNTQVSNSIMPIDDLIDGVQASYDDNDLSNDVEVPNKRHLFAMPKPERGSEELSKPSQVQVAQEQQRTPTLEETNSSIFNFFSPRGSSVKVEEISDVTQEAEFWISMNDPQRAIEILAAQEQVEHPDSPVPWLFLLDLYRTVADKGKYNCLRDRFISFFNANIPEFEADLSQITTRHLEDFEHLIDRVCRAWDGNGIIPYLESLLIDDRDGKRAGFDLPVYRDILMLLGIAHELERIKSIEGPVVRPVVSMNQIEKIEAKDPVDEADFNTIEFEMIDFPKVDLAKNKR